MSRLRVSLYILALLFPAVTLAGTKDVKVETVPSGAQVEENGSIVCKTPCTLKVPSYYFGKKHTAFSSHGIEPIRLRITKEGFLHQKVSTSQLDRSMRRTSTATICMTTT